MVRIIKTGLKNLVTLSLKEKILSFPSLCMLSRIQAICAIKYGHKCGLSALQILLIASLTPLPLSLSLYLFLWSSDKTPHPQGRGTQHRLYCTVFTIYSVDCAESVLLCHLYTKCSITVCYLYKTLNI